MSRMEKNELKVVGEEVGKKNELGAKEKN
jgi:hypothetical protein